MTIEFLELAQQCAPMMDSTRLAAIVSVESGFSPFNIRISSEKALREQPKDRQEAIAVATSLQIEGELVGLGLGGLSIQSLSQLGLTIADAFDPCKNIAATGQLIATYYAAARVAGSDNPSRDALWSFFGRGDPEPGRITGYDKQIELRQAKLKPQLAKLELNTGVAPHIPDKDGGVSSVAMVDRASETPSVIRAQELPQRQRSKTEALQEPEKVPTRQWDIFSSTRDSQVFIFNR